MKLESRIEKLEHEFKILKSEIQTTLLEIQEQILTHYYPALRAEDSTPPAHLQGMAEALRNGQQAQTRLNSLQESLSSNLSSKGQNGHSPVGERMPASGERRSSRNGASSAFTDVTYEWMDEDEEDPLALQAVSVVAPQTREVSLSDLKRSRHDAAQGTAPPAQVLPAETASQAQPLDFAAFAGWVGESIHKVGKERTQKAVETYASAVSLPADVKEMLLQLIALSDGPGHVDPANANGVMEALVKLDQIWRGGAYPR